MENGTLVSWLYVYCLTTYIRYVWNTQTWKVRSLNVRTRLGRHKRYFIDIPLKKWVLKELEDCNTILPNPVEPGGLQSDNYNYVVKFCCLYYHFRHLYVASYLIITLQWKLLINLIYHWHVIATLLKYEILIFINRNISANRRVGHWIERLNWMNLKF